ncbi:glycoside hydrolase family 43 protein [Paenibacillus hexagrammi]|uniref:Glycoside hydrolase family 43 protein n=1 Tax=Paenibacillus hexagrammi TaxID=2908839 RepID=A0ABY3SHD1_9BACL|nr:glycoside hydrolase family 43 protein [Paenibacillus sp. YPD9-1]UJF32515.1 glycoside hydrolase family 43 protein [Paenibacillus sp. YPD9-1]
MKDTFKPVYGLSAVGTRFYQNPLPVTQQGMPLDPAHAVFPDPYVIKYNGEYYCFATGIDGIPVLHSKDLTEWRHLGYAYRSSQEKQYWGPCVLIENGRFYLYYSSMKADSEDVHEQRLNVAVADHPAGPYTYRKTLFNTFSIDAHVVKDAKGELVLFYSTNEVMGADPDRPGTVILADRLLDPMTVSGNPHLIVKPTMDEEIYEENRFGDGRDWHTIEGAFYLTAKNRGYVMYSGNAFTKPFYYIGYSASEEPLEAAGFSRQRWQKYPNDATYAPLLKQNAEVEGVGHNSVVMAPNNVDPWVVYHGRDARRSPEPGREERQLRMDPLLWNGERMWVPGPTWTEQNAPALPSLIDRFDQEDGSVLSSLWEALSGSWHIHEGQALQSSSSGFRLALTKESYDSYVYEVNAKWVPGHMGGQYGALIGYKDAWNYVRVLLDAGQRKLAVETVVNGVCLEAAEVSLKTDFAYERYHRLVVTKLGRRVNVALDDVVKLELDVCSGFGRVGMFTHVASAFFDGAALTEHMELTPENQQSFLRYLNLQCGEGERDGWAEEEGAHWRMQHGELSCMARDGKRRSVTLAASLLGGSFTFAADVELPGAAKPGAIGLSLIAADQRESARVSADARELRGTSHTFLVRKAGSNLQVWLDQLLLYAGAAEPAAGVALWSNVPVRYSHIRLTRS